MTDNEKDLESPFAELCRATDLVSLCVIHSLEMEELLHDELRELSDAELEALSVALIKLSRSASRIAELARIVGLHEIRRAAPPPRRLNPAWN